MAANIEKQGLLSGVECPSGWKRFLQRRIGKDPATAVAKAALEAAPKWHPAGRAESLGNGLCPRIPLRSIRGYSACSSIWER